MLLQFEARFEKELNKIKQSLARKNSTKKTEAVNRRIGLQIQISIGSQVLQNRGIKQ